MISIIDLKEIEKEIIKLIYRFSKPRRWRYGYNQKYIERDLSSKYSIEQIRNTLDYIENKKIIYKIIRIYGRLKKANPNVYWFLRKEYRYLGEKLSGKELFLKSGKLKSKNFNLINLNEINLDYEELSEEKQIKFQKKRLRRLLEHLDFLIKYIKEYKNVEIEEQQESIFRLKQVRREIKEAIKSREYSSRYLEGLVEYYHFINEMMERYKEEESLRITEKEPQVKIDPIIKELEEAIGEFGETKKIEELKELWKKEEKKKERFYSCDGFIAPEGWKFQDCKEKTISILRIKDGDWNTWDADTDVKDAFAFAEAYDKDDFGYIWLVDSNQPLQIWLYTTQYPIRRIEAIKILISIAECVNSGDISQENLKTILRKWLPERKVLTWAVDPFQKKEGENCFKFMAMDGEVSEYCPSFIDLHRKKNQILLKSGKFRTKTFLITKEGRPLLDAITDLDLEDLTESKVDKFIKKQLNKFLKTEYEIRQWIEKFLSDKWYKEELNRIKRFESISEDIEGFEIDPEIEKFYRIPTVEGGTKGIYEKSPDVDKDKIKESIQRVIPKYAKNLYPMLEEAKKELDFYKSSMLKKPKDILNIITKKCKSYWEYLGYLRNAYVNIFNIINLFDYSLTIQYILQNLILELYQIDEQYWFKDEIFGLKKRVKLIDEDL